MNMEDTVQVPVELVKRLRAALSAYGEFEHNYRRQLPEMEFGPEMDAAMDALSDITRVSVVPPATEQENRWLPGERGNSGAYVDDNCEGGQLQVFKDEQGDVWLSMFKPGHRMVSVRMVAHCARRPHVIRAARQLAAALIQSPDALPTPEPRL